MCDYSKTIQTETENQAETLYTSTSDYEAETELKLSDTVV